MAKQENIRVEDFARMLFCFMTTHPWAAALFV